MKDTSKASLETISMYRYIYPGFDDIDSLQTVHRQGKEES